MSETKHTPGPWHTAGDQGVQIRSQRDQIAKVWPRRATLGDTMICGVRHPHPRTIAMKLETPASVAYANKLLARKASGWRLVEIRA